MTKLLISEMEIHGKPCIYTALLEDNRLVEFHFEARDKTTILNNIYVAQVDKVAKNIQSAFVKISPQQTCYYPLKELPTAIYANPKKDRSTLVAGDQILVQVSREATKEKQPTVTTNLSFTGKYLVLTSGRKGMGFSGKLPSEVRELIGKWLAQESCREYGLVVRTNAADATKDVLLKELTYLKERYQRVIQYGTARTCFSLLEEHPPFYISVLRNVYQQDLEEIITDVRELYDTIHAYMEEYQRDDLSKLRFYEDAAYPLAKMYSMEKKLSDATHEKVWLPSGGFLVLQPTEAFVCIDVNTGKYTGRKKAEETFRKINLEAAREIARQLRVRNLSGIILIDFINMSNPDHVEELLHVLQKYLRRDPIKTKVHDMTELKIVEVTRRRIERPLHEELKELL